MDIFDISQELFHSRVYPGDEAPGYSRKMEIAKNETCNLTVFHMCAHNGTHVDAPWHFIENGKRVEELDLHKLIGPASVVNVSGKLTAGDIGHIMKCSHERLLLKGNAVVTPEAAKELNRHHISLIGVEAQTVGPFDDPEEVHLELLGNEVVLLEGLVLKDVPDGEYLLNAAPLNLGGADGAPCRAVLLRL